MKTTISNLQAAATLTGAEEIPVQQSGFTRKASVLTLLQTTVANTFNGVKTFASPPIVPTPTAGGEATNKTYVDTLVSSIGVTTTATITGNYTALATDKDIFVNTASALTLTLPDALSVAKEYIITRLVAGAAIAIDTAGADTINGNATHTFVASASNTAISIKKSTASTWIAEYKEAPVPSCILTASATAAASSALIWGSAAEDTHGGYNATNGQYTVKVAGLYMVSGTRLISSSGEDTDINLTINGSNTAVLYSYAAAGVIRRHGTTTTVRLAVGDIITFVQTATGSRTYTNGRTCITRIGA